MKNILSDTDFTKGWDNRFGVVVCVGKVTKIEVSEKGANVRVTLPDRVDHNGQPLITKPIPVLMPASQSKKSFAVPRLNTNVLLVKLPNGTSNYMVVGSFYTSKDPPPVTDPNLDYVIYDDGSTMQFDASTGNLTWNLKGGFSVRLQQGMDLQMEKDFSLKCKDMTLEADGGEITIKGATALLIDCPSIHLKGAMTFEGNITHIGDMTTSGHHTDAAGHHTTSTRESDLLARIEALETRVAQLEQRHGS